MSDLDGKDYILLDSEQNIDFYYNSYPAISFDYQNALMSKNIHFIVIFKYYIL